MASGGFPPVLPLPARHLTCLVFEVFIVIKAFPGEIEKRFDVRVPGVLGGLFGALTDGGQKGEDFFGRQGL